MNSTRPYSDSLTDVHSDDLGFPLIYDQGQIDETLFSSGYHHDELDCIHIPVDRTTLSRHENIRFNVLDIVTISRILERHYGRPVQMEFTVLEKNGPSHLLQVRPLPSSLFAQQKIEFPSDLEPILELDALGFCDRTLEILPIAGVAGDEFADHHNETGVVIFHNTFMGSGNMGGIYRACPKEGAVILLSQSDAGRGHVETIALEKGLILLFNRGDQSRGSGIQRLREISRLCIRNAVGDLRLGRVRIVANGSKARIYEVPEEAGDVYFQASDDSDIFNISGRTDD